MKIALFIVFAISIFMVVGSTEGHSQGAPRGFIVLTSNDTIFGRTSLKMNTRKSDPYFKVVKRENWKMYQVDEVSAFRISRTDYIMKPDLHSEFVVPYHTVLESGKVKLFGQQCNGCNLYLSLHVEFEDGNIVCVDEENYYDEVLPALCTSPEFKEQILNQSVKYPFFQNLIVYRLISIIELYNKIAE